MDSVRYYLALILIMTIPGALPFWISIHPFVHLWRKVGLRLAYTFHIALLATIATGIFLVRKPLLSAQLGPYPVLITLAVPIFLLGLFVGIQRRRQMGTKVMMGFPELAPARPDNKLITKGIYARMRNPRYVELLLFLLAYALFTNYLAVYVVFLLTVAGIGLIVWLEEKELRERFGKEFEAYCERVPRFIPRQ